MAIESALIAETGAAALLFAATFLMAGSLHPFRSLVHDRRSIVSFGAGVATAYVFVHVMPELHVARTAFAESTSIVLRYEGMAIYYVALIGFLVFYGLDHLRKHLRQPDGAERDGTAFKVHIGGFAAYVWLMSYLLVRGMGEEVAETGLFAFAMTVHFIGVDHSLREEHGAQYQRIGRFILAAMALLGWATGMLIALPHGAVALLVAFISGAVILNSTIMELPPESDGRFVPFLCGGLIYGLFLLPLG
jgi:hypothetical protein